MDLGGSWGVLERSWGVSGSSWRDLGRVLEDLVEGWEGLGDLGGVFRKFLGLLKIVGFMV